MSFSSDVKEELSTRIDMARHCQIAEFAAIMGMSGRIRRASGKRMQIEMSTENEIARYKFIVLLEQIFDIDTGDIIYVSKSSRDTTIRIENQEYVAKILQTLKWADETFDNIEPVFVDPRIVQKDCCKKAFIRGAFIAAGEYENLGRGVSYCATCDAALYKEREAIVIGFNEEALSEAEFLAQTAKKVYYMPLYNKDKDINTLQAGKDSLKDNIDIIKGKPLSIERREDKMVLIMEDRELAADGIFVLRESMKPAQLVPGIKIEDNKVITDKSMASNIKGLYAAGDITGVPYQYVKAAGEGNVAALSAVGYLAALNRAGK